MKSMRDSWSQPVEIAELTTRMRAVKELLFYSLCRPHIVADWLFCKLAAKERQLLLRFSTDLASVFFPHEPVNEADIVAQQSQIYILRGNLDMQAKKLPLLLNKPGEIRFVPELRELLQMLEALMRRRYEGLSLDGIFPQSEIMHLKISIEEMQTHLDRIEADFDQEKHDPSMKSLMLGMMGDMKKINHELVRVEESAFGLSQLHAFQAAMTLFAMEGNGNEIKHVLAEQAGLANVLHIHVDSIRPLQDKFLAYLQHNNSQGRNMFFFKQEQADAPVQALPHMRQINS